MHVRAQVKKFQNAHPAAGSDGTVRVSFGNGSVGERIAPLVPSARPAHLSLPVLCASQPASLTMPLVVSPGLGLLPSSKGLEVMRRAAPRSAVRRSRRGVIGAGTVREGSPRRFSGLSLRDTESAALRARGMWQTNEQPAERASSVHASPPPQVTECSGNAESAGVTVGDITVELQGEKLPVDMTLQEFAERVRRSPSHRRRTPFAGVGRDRPLARADCNGARVRAQCDRDGGVRYGTARESQREVSRSVGAGGVGDGRSKRVAQRAPPASAVGPVVSSRCPAPAAEPMKRQTWRCGSERRVLSAVFLGSVPVVWWVGRPRATAPAAPPSAPPRRVRP